MTPALRFDPNMLFTMILIEESKTGQLVSRKVGKKIVSMPLEKFFDSLNCIEEDAVWWLFEMKDFVGEV